MQRVISIENQYAAVELVDITKSLIAHPELRSIVLSPEDHMIYKARISNQSNELNTATAPKLLASCIKRKHWSVFDQISMSFKVSTTRDVSAQILRHWSIKPQEFSQRYSEVESDILDGRSIHDLFEFREQGKTKQGSSNVIQARDIDIQYGSRLQDALEAVYTIYKEMVEGVHLTQDNVYIKDKVSKESARRILPIGTPTELYISGTLRSFITYVMTRTMYDTQKEHRAVARCIKYILSLVTPYTVQAVDELVFNEIEGAAVLKAIKELTYEDGTSNAVIQKSLGYTPTMYSTSIYDANTKSLVYGGDSWKSCGYFDTGEFSNTEYANHQLNVAAAEEILGGY